jgi:hypothetical protein
MSAILFLLIAVVITACGSTVLYIRQRPRTSVHSGVETFRRGLDALGGARRPQTDAGPRHQLTRTEAGPADRER